MRFVIFTILLSLWNISAVSQSTNSISHTLMEEENELMDSAKFVEAFYVFSDLILLDSTIAEAYFLRGQCHYHSKEEEHLDSK
jgi:hypothetical protein